MRFPIRSQILLPTSIVMLAVVLGSFAVNVRLAQRSATKRIQRRIEDVSKILEEAAFPLTDRVLIQMSGLTGAEFVLVDQTGITGASESSLLTMNLPSAPGNSTYGLGESVTANDKQYFHRILSLDSARHAPGLQLHAFFDANEYRRIWQRALMPSLVAAGSALVAAVACAYWIGGSVTKSAAGIMSQLRRISSGDFSISKLPKREDELRQIAAELNQTAELLRRYESDVRDGERMKTMVAMGAGLAHQIRNSATGCRMALDIFSEENEATDDEGMLVARRQLSLMENYLQRFLLLARVEPNRVERATEDLNTIVAQAISLVQHSAKHLNTELKWTPNEERLPLTGDVISVEQAIVNLLLNAIEAASAGAVNYPADMGTRQAIVRVQTRRVEDSVEIAVSDNGAGPSETEDVFAPFVSDKKAGVGLGLAVVKDVADEHRGDAMWQRADGWTEFVMKLPLSSEAN